MGKLQEAIINSTEFRNITKDAFDSYFAFVSHMLSTGQYSTTAADPVPSFPQMMIVTVLPNHFAVELVGGRRNNRELKAVQRRLDNPDLFFGQFDYPPGTKAAIEASGLQMSGFAVITAEAQKELDRRFPKIADAYPTKIVPVGEGFGPALVFPPDAPYVQVNDVLFGNALNGMVRIRHIRFALLVAKHSSTQEYRDYLAGQLTRENHSQLIATPLISGKKAETAFRAAQFANIFLMNSLHETRIGAFIDQHREIFLSALEAQQIISEPYLPWLVPSPDPEEKAINPDLFVARPDGYWDVYDLKLALLNRKDLTTGRRRRRRFVSTVEDGIAQLAHYREFLSIPEHAAMAKEKYGAAFNNPRFVLVVGNYENIDPDKVADARRRFGDIELIDYDTLLQLYLTHENALPVKGEISMNPGRAESVAGRAAANT